MTPNIDPVADLLLDARDRLLKLEGQMATLRGEISAYEKVLSAFGGSVMLRGAAIPAIVRRRKRGLSDVWKLVLAWIGSQSVAPDTEGIWNFVAEKKLEIQRPSLRSQISLYTQQGYLRREGIYYHLTDTGRVAANGAFARITPSKEPVADDDEV